ncbi:MAG UNVERIFIED_CONTAM: hypothetical protein LVR29_21290 [Microcystis novacekii LVE1205-3]|jgi:hypothetical protein
MENPAALELRRLQMLTEIGAENNTSTIILIPSEYLKSRSKISRKTITKWLNCQ